MDAMFDSLVQQADQQPLPAPGCADGACRPTVTGGELRLNAFNLLLVKDGNTRARVSNVE
jgi:hypothetical protein